MAIDEDVLLGEPTGCVGVVTAAVGLSLTAVFCSSTSLTFASEALKCFGTVRLIDTMVVVCSGSG